MKAETTASKQRGRPFKPGRSGNPSGRPKGSRHKLTVLAENLMEAEAEDVVRSVINAAKGGDMIAARVIIDRILPARKSRPVALELPKVETPADVVEAMTKVIEAVASGEIDPDEASTLASVLDVKRRTFETVELGERIKRIEERLLKGRG